MNNIHVLIPLISSIAYVALIVITIVYGRRGMRNTFLLFLGAAMLWSFLSFQVHWNRFPDYTILWHKFLIVFFAAMPVTYYHFISIFSNRISIRRLWLGYGLIVLLAVFTFAGFVIKDSRVDEGGLLYFDFGAWTYFLAIFSVSFMLMAMFILIQNYRHSIDSQTRNRTAYLLVGAVLVVSLSLTNLSSTLSKYPIDHIGNLTNALLITYVVARYQLMDIKLVIRTGLSYSGLTIFITAMYLLLLWVLQTFLQTWTGYALAVGFAFLLAVILTPLRRKTQEWVDRLFYRETYDYRQMLLKFSRRVSNILNLSELAKDMLYPITKALHVNWASLLIPDASMGEFTTQFTQQASGETVTKATDLRFSKDNPIVTWLAREGKPLRRDLVEILPEFKGLWEGERDELEAFEVELLCPIVSKGDLIGILALGRKQSETPYSSEDVDLLMTMASAAAVAIENAMVLDALKKQQAQVRELLAQTVQAQEDERKRISVELHDSVTQWLVGASYRIQACNALLPESDSKEARGELKEVESTLDKSLKELRRVMTGLHPPALAELGLVHAVRQLTGQLEAIGIACDFKATGTPVRLPPSEEITIFRIVQEALHNVRKHSEASKVVVSLQFHPDSILAKIRDNGKGFDLSQTLDRAILVGSLGLFGMKQRTETVGGTLEIKTKPGSGTTLTLRLPLSPHVCEEASERLEEEK